MAMSMCCIGRRPSTLNPYLSSGTKDVETASLILEGLAGFDQDGVVFARLAESVPTVENGGITADLMQITWKLKAGLLWSDGTPVTSADAKFTWQYCTAPDGGCAQAARYEGIADIETPDDLTVIIKFAAPKPNPYTAFVGGTSPILQAAQFANCLGAAASTCTDQNFMPIGTGPYKVTEFKTNDTVSLEANPNYRDPAKPAFATMTVKGGGDAEAAARAVMETGEFDYAWNTQINPELQEQMKAAGGKGVFLNGFGTLGGTHRDEHDRPVGRSARRRAFATVASIRTRFCRTSTCARRCRWPLTARCWSMSATATQAARPATWCPLPWPLPRTTPAA